MKRFLKWLALAVAIIVLGLGGFAAYGIYSVYYGKHVYETTPPALPAHLNQTAILVFSKTNGYRHEEAIPAANRALEAIARAHGDAPSTRGTRAPRTSRSRASRRAPLRHAASPSRDAPP